VVDNMDEDEGMIGKKIPVAIFTLQMA